MPKPNPERFRDPVQERRRSLNRADAFMADIVCLILEDGGLTLANVNRTSDFIDMTTDPTGAGHGIDPYIALDDDRPGQSVPGVLILLPQMQRRPITIEGRGGRWTVEIPDETPPGLDDATFLAFRRLVTRTEAKEAKPIRMRRERALRAFAAGMELYRHLKEKRRDPDTLLKKTVQVMNEQIGLFRHRQLMVAANRRFLAEVARRIPPGIAFVRCVEAILLGMPAIDPDRFDLGCCFGGPGQAEHGDWPALRWGIAPESQGEFTLVDPHRGAEGQIVRKGFSCTAWIPVDHSQRHHFRLFDVHARRLPAAFAKMAARLRTFDDRTRRRTPETTDRVLDTLIGFAAERIRAFRAIGRFPNENELTFVDPA